MKRTIITVLLAALAGARAAAQTPGEPHLVFTISAGLSTGSDLWRLDRHPQPVSGGGPNDYDTLALARKLVPGVVAGLAASYYPSPRFGWSGEVTYFGLTSEQRCTGPAAYMPESDHINQQACDRANGLHSETSVVGFMGGGTWRPFPDRQVEPFFRALIGPGLLGGSFVQTSGVVRSTQCLTVDNFCNLTLADESKRTQLTFVANLSFGISFAISDAYRARFEARDVITSLPVVTGNGDGSNANAAIVTTGRVIRHVPTFTFGFDIVLERRHTRRY